MFHQQVFHAQLHFHKFSLSSGHKMPSNLSEWCIIKLGDDKSARSNNQFCFYLFTQLNQNLKSIWHCHVWLISGWIFVYPKYNFTSTWNPIMKPTNLSDHSTLTSHFPGSLFSNECKPFISLLTKERQKILI